MEPVNLDEIEASGANRDDDQLLALNNALDRLAAEEPRKAELVKLRCIVGLTIEEAAQTLDISEPTAKRWWTFSRAWLFHDMRLQGL